MVKSVKTLKGTEEYLNEVLVHQYSGVPPE